jgi:hypothetical protein
VRLGILAPIPIGEGGLGGATGDGERGGGDAGAGAGGLGGATGDGERGGGDADAGAGAGTTGATAGSAGEPISPLQSPPKRDLLG